MDSKVWWASKTLWVNALAIVGIVVQGVTGTEISAFGAEEQSAALALINMLLRAVTSTSITATKG